MYNIDNLYKRDIMTLTATQLKQQTYLMDNVKKEDIIITKRDRPFAVIVDIERYDALIRNQKDELDEKEKEDKKAIFEQAFGILPPQNIDPVEWQKSIREESDSMLYEQKNR